MKNRKLIIGIAALLVVIAALIVVWKVAGPKPETGTKAYTVIVVDPEGKETKYTGKTDAEYLHGLMDELAAKNKKFTFDGEDSQYGFTVMSVNGVLGDWNEGTYWAIYVNGEYGNYGVDEQPVADGDEFKFAYEKFQ